MTRNRGYKYRAYPTKAQITAFAMMFGCVRFVYNYYLEWRTSRWHDENASTNYVMSANHMKAVLKDAFPWLYDADSTALQQSLRDLDTAFRNFFERRSGYPRFKRKSDKQSYRTMCVSGNIRIDGNRIRLPKVGWVKISNSRPFDGRIKSATVTKTAGGRYYITLLVEEEYEILPNAGGELGIDVGLKEFYTDSRGRKVDNPRTLRRHEKRLKRLQRRLSRKQKGSRNRRKAKVALAREHEKVADIRKDFLHKQALALACENQVVCAEDLNISGMMKNHRLAKSISDVSWNMFFTILRYKLEDRGGVLIKVPAFYPSSQTCSNCGYQNPLVKDLSVRTWICPECGTIHDRDINAALNILEKGLEMLQPAA